MSEDAVELVRKIYAAWREGRGAAEYIAEDMEYVNPPDAVEPGVLKGRRSLERVRDVYPDFTVEPERFVDAGDDVVVIGVARAHSASGVETQWRQGYVWTVRDGQAVRLRWFNDPRQALEAAGLQE